MFQKGTALHELATIVGGRTRYEGKEPDLLDRIYLEVVELKGELKKWKSEHKSMSKGAQTNAKVINLQAKQISNLREEIETLTSKKY